MTGREVVLRITAAVVAAMLVLVALAVLGIGSSEARSGSFDGDVTLTTDAAGSALFSATGLAPGSTVTNCIAVTLAGSTTTPAELRLHGASTGDLDPHLRLRVEVGEGGGFEDCASFAGAQRFEGSLASFVATHGDDDPGLLVRDPVAPGRATTFRFSLTLDDAPAAQGASSTSAYTWRAQPISGAPLPPAAPGDEAGAPPDDPDDADPTEPDVRSPGEPDDRDDRSRQTDRTAPDRAAPPVPDGSQPPTPEQAPTSDSETSERPGTGGSDDLEVAPTAPDGRSGHSPAGDDRTVAAPDHLDDRPSLGFDWDRLAEVLVFVAERSSYLLILLLIVLLFLAVQDRIDRKDPKLALAPREPDLDLRFEPPPSEGGGHQ